MMVPTVIWSIGTKLAQAELILLAELYNSRTTVDESSTDRFIFAFHTGTSFENQVRFSRIPVPADIGQTFPADPGTVAHISSIMTDGDHTINIIFAETHGAVRQVFTDEFFNGPYMGDIPTMHSPDNPALVMNAYVPKLGPGFSGYLISEVDMTIHGFGIDQPNGPGTFFRYWGAQQYRFFGERVPEPTSSILVGVALIGYAWLQKRSYRLLHRVGRMPDDEE
jgi:hypothetical protein